jgi:CHAD domain-containing protein
MERYRIQKNEDLSETYRRVIREQILLSVGFCQRSDEEPDTAAHEIRKCTKRIRAVYRLFRKATGKSTCHRGQDHFRTISGLLADFRLSRVHADTLSRISIDKGLTADAMTMGNLVSDFQKNHRQFTTEVLKNQQLFPQISHLLSAELERLENDPVSACEFGMLADSIKKTYRTGSENLKILVNQYSAENLHNLRKTVKCLWYQMTMIRPIWPSAISMTVHCLDVLSERLGSDHDMHELVLHLNREAEVKKNPVPLHLTDYINLKRKKLYNGILPLALRLFSEKPGAFTGRLNAYYGIWKNDASRLVL